MINNIFGRLKYEWNEITLIKVHENVWKRILLTNLETYNETQ